MIFQKQIEKIYKAQLFCRYDDNGTVKYFSYEDFHGMHADAYTIPSSHGHTLKGYFYSYDGCKAERLIIFEHGLGGGHRSYMKEIERLCAAGYRVFSYDHTGCMESGGAGAGGFAQSLCDLDDCLKALVADARIDTSDISVMGHSWGGMSTLNITALHPHVKRLVVLSGPVSAKRMIAQNFSGLLSPYQAPILKLEEKSNPAYVNFDAVETLKATKARALLIYSDNDAIVQKKHHYDTLFAALNGKENIEFLLERGKGHNPNYTHAAVAYLAQLAKAMKHPPKTNAEKEAFRNSFDWNNMTEQDEAVWARILAFLAQ